MNNVRHDRSDHFDRSVRAALDDIVAEAPTPADRPEHLLEVRAIDDTPHRRHLVLAVAAGLAVVAGSVAIVGRSTSTTTTNPAASGESSDASGTGPRSTQAGGVSAVTTLPDASPSNASLLDSLLCPVDATVMSATVMGVNTDWFSDVRVFVSSDDALLSVLFMSPDRDVTAGAVETRTVGSTTFHFHDEDGNHVYMAAFAGHVIAVVAPLEYQGDPWSTQALDLMSAIDAAPDGFTAPTGWTELAAGHPDQVYDISFEVPFPAPDGPLTKARLVQSTQPLGFLIAAAGPAYARGVVKGVATSAANASLSGLPSNADDAAWFLVDVESHQYVAWNTTYGSAMLMVESDIGPDQLRTLGVVLESGHPQLWSAALVADVPQNSISAEPSTTGC